MKIRTCLMLLGVMTCNASMAARIVTDTRVGDTLIKRTETYANAAGDLRVDERGYGSSSSISDSAAAGSSAAKVEYHLGKINDTMLYQSKGQAIVVLEGDQCRRLTADSEPPAVLNAPGMDLGDARSKMAEAMKQASGALEQAMAEARKEGMTAEQQRQLEQFTKPFMETPDVKPRDTLEVYALNQRARVGKYSAEGYGVRDLDGNEKHRVWMVSTGDIAGGAHVRKAMRGMIDTYSEFIDQFGGAALMDTSLTTMFESDELAGKYPVRIEDLDSGEVTDVVEAQRSDGGAEYYPECEVRDMFGM